MTILTIRKFTVAASMAAILFTSGLQLAFAAKEVDINHADSTTIAESLDGIGQSKAQAIVAYREKHGPFAQLQDVAAVKGVGEKTLENNAKYIVIK